MHSLRAIFKPSFNSAFSFRLLFHFSDLPFEEVPTEGRKISKFEAKSFSDNVRLNLKAGDGGCGAITFFTDKRVRRGAPDGGHGGNGGNIQVQARINLHDLSHLRLKHIEANNGHKGGGLGKDGKNGGKTLIHVPCGTLVFEIEGVQQRKKFLIDLSENKQSFVLVRGGEAGKGNKLHPGIPNSDRFGKEGESKIILLEMKMLADIGLVGFPNVGKSTFLAASTRALPKIANYQFTTLKPSVGLVKFVDDYKLSITDIPGIIQDAHLDRGLGLQFLRHIERTKILLFVLDITKQDPLDQYRKLEHELFEYKGNSLKDKMRVVVFNKADCVVDSVQRYNACSAKLSCPHFLISAKEGLGVGQVLLELRKSLELFHKEEERLQLLKAKQQYESHPLF